MQTTDQKTLILDSFQTLLNTRGLRGATIDAVASLSGLSKSGMLHHFRSREQLVSGLLARLEGLTAADVRAMKAAPDVALDFYVQWSLNPTRETAQCLEAVHNLAKDDNEEAVEALRADRKSRYDALLSCGYEPALVRLTMFCGDGMRQNLSLAEERETDEFTSPEAAAEVFAVMRRYGTQTREDFRLTPPGYRRPLNPETSDELNEDPAAATS